MNVEEFLDYMKSEEAESRILFCTGFYDGCERHLLQQSCFSSYNAYKLGFKYGEFVVKEKITFHPLSMRTHYFDMGMIHAISGKDEFQLSPHIRLLSEGFQFGHNLRVALRRLAQE